MKYFIRFNTFDLTDFQMQQDNNLHHPEVVKQFIFQWDDILYITIFYSVQYLFTIEHFSM